MNSELLAYSYKSQPIHINKSDINTINKNIYSTEYPPINLSPPKEDMFNKLIRERLMNSKLLIHNNYYNIYNLK